MAERKTQPNASDVDTFLDAVDEAQRADAAAVRSLMHDVTGDPGTMWGTSIVGFGENSYTTADGKTHEWFQVGFSPRKRDLTLYVMDGFDEYEELLARLGKHRTGKSCLYVKRLDDIDIDVLRELLAASVAHVSGSS